MLKLQLRSRIIDAASRAGTPVTEDEVAVLITGDTTVFKPDGEPLCIVVRNAISRASSVNAYDSLHSLRNQKTDNRGKYSGEKRRGEHASKDGSISKQNRTVNKDGKVALVASAVIGFYNRQPRIPFCRETAFVSNEVEKWQRCLPMIGEASSLFEKHAPARYGKQMKASRRGDKAFIVHVNGKATPFSTITVNNNVVASVHKDAGDYKDGLGLITCIRRGTYSGGWLVFTEYGVAADLQDGDAIFFNSHDWHGVTPFYNTKPGFERISVVYYLRNAMADCGSPNEERARAAKYRSDFEKASK